MFEALEQRILLSADAIGAVDAAGLLRIGLDDASHNLVVSRIGESADGGARVRVDLDGWFWEAGDAERGVKSLAVQGGAGSDRIDVANAGVRATVDGGAGDDTVVGATADSAWAITAQGAGHVGLVDFTGVENLLGADGNRDTFTLFAGGGLSGVADGGVGGFDSLVIDRGADLARALPRGRPGCRHRDPRWRTPALRGARAAHARRLRDDRRSSRPRPATTISSSKPIRPTRPTCGCARPTGRWRASRSRAAPRRSRSTCSAATIRSRSRRSATACSVR
jgi:hypothetical protein